MSFREGYDFINLNDLIKYFNRFYKTHLKTKLNLFSKEELLNCFLQGLCVGENTKYGPDVLLTAFKKVMSGNHPSSQVVSACFGRELELEQLKKKEENPAVVTNIEGFRKNAIEGKCVYTEYIDSRFSEEDKTELFEELLSMCRFPHFSEEELETFRKWLDVKEYEEFFHAIMFHAFSCAHYNQPYMYTERLYQEALTLKVYNRMRDDLLKLAADHGHKAAALEYAMRVFEKDLAVGVHYFLEALPQQASYWSLAYELETSWEKFDDKMLKDVKEKLKKDVFEYVEQLCNTTPDGTDEREFFIDVVPVVEGEKHRECLGMAVKIYQYLCTRDRFSKAFNSIGKLLLIGQIRVRSEEAQQEGTNYIDIYPKSREQAFRFLDQAIATGNGNALVNKARYYTKRINSPNPEIRAAAERNYENSIYWLKEMADLHEPIACEFYGQALAEAGRMEEAVPYYEAAARYDRITAAKTLAKYYMEKGDWARAEEFCRLIREKEEQ